MFMDVSKNMSITKPKIIAELTDRPSDPALGKKHMTMMAAVAPMSR